MPLTPDVVKRYHVFLASPGDVNVERQHVRRFFDEYNRTTAHLWNAEFRVIDWENYSTTGVGRPQELITKQTLEKYKDSLALVVGVMAQRFGSPSGKAESGTEEEFNWAFESHKATGFPEIKWFFRKTGKLEVPEDPDEAEKALARPWAEDRTAQARIPGHPAVNAQPFDSEPYRIAVVKRFDVLNFEMLDTTGAFYSGVRLWNVFVPQSVREMQQYNPRLLEIPKDQQQRLSKGKEGAAKELTDEQQAEQLRREFFTQPSRAVLEVIDEALPRAVLRGGQRLVVLGDPGSGKSSLIRYLALRWASMPDPNVRDSLEVPIVIELNSYHRWTCDGRKDFRRFLEEAPMWHNWRAGTFERLLQHPDRVLLLLDGLDEIFDARDREEIVSDIQRFVQAHPKTSIILTSRVVGYQPRRLSEVDFRHFMLQDLDSEQVDVFVDRWHEQTFDDATQAAPKRSRLKKAIRDSKSIAMLAGNPLLLTMMAILNRNQELPRDRVDLYGQAARVLLQQWDTERALAAFPGLSAEIGWLRRPRSFDVLHR